MHSGYIIIIRKEYKLTILATLMTSIGCDQACVI